MAKNKRKKALPLPKPVRRVAALVKIGRVALPVLAVFGAYTLTAYRRQHDAL